MNEVINALWLNVLLCFAGLLWHFSMKWQEYRETTAKVGLVAYIRAVPAQSLATALATVIAFGASYGFGLLNAGTAIAAGYMGSSVAENWANKHAKP